MNVLLWILQVALALLTVAGGAFKTSSPAPLAQQFGAGPGGWRIAGVFEIVGAVLLVAPAATGWLPILTPIAAAALALENLALAGVYARHSLKVTAANPLPWSIGIGLVAAFVAYGRFALAPLA